MGGRVKGIINKQCEQRADKSGKGKNRSSEATKNSAETPQPRIKAHEQNHQPSPSRIRDVEKTIPKINASGFFPSVFGKHETTGMMQKSKKIEHSRSNGNLLILGWGVILIPITSQ